MKYLLITAALSLGASGACLAQTSMPSSHHSAHSKASVSLNGQKGQPALAQAKVNNKCHIEGTQLVCTQG